MSTKPYLTLADLPFQKVNNANHFIPVFDNVELAGICTNNEFITYSEDDKTLRTMESITQALQGNRVEPVGRIHIPSTAGVVSDMPYAIVVPTPAGNLHMLPSGLALWKEPLNPRLAIVLDESFIEICGMETFLENKIYYSDRFNMVRLDDGTLIYYNQNGNNEDTNFLLRNSDRILSAEERQHIEFIVDSNYGNSELDIHFANLVQVLQEIQSGNSEIPMLENHIIQNAKYILED